MFTDMSLTAIAIFIVSLLISMTVHEFMHAYFGWRLGDPTAHNEGRITLNPLAHIDPIMTILLPVATFLLPPHIPILAAKPVPFTPWQVRYREWGVAMLAAAGPLSNLVLAVVAALAARPLDTGTILFQILYLFATLNVGLFLFNLIPIPPLDGSRVLYAFLPESLQEVMSRIEPYGFFIVFGLVMIGGFGGILSGGYSFLMNLLF